MVGVYSEHWSVDELDKPLLHSQIRGWERALFRPDYREVIAYQLMFFGRCYTYIYTLPHTPFGVFLPSAQRWTLEQEPKWPSRSCTDLSSRSSSPSGPTESWGSSNTWDMKMWDTAWSVQLSWEAQALRGDYFFLHECRFTALTRWSFDS